VLENLRESFKLSDNEINFTLGQQVTLRGPGWTKSYHGKILNISDYALVVDTMEVGIVKVPSSVVVHS
jgi:hypothetical protein